jgi:uncharacterized protein YbgA (DUF1722 family)/uncharacterized protein YbbK (DUF523 family)
MTAFPKPRIVASRCLEFDSCRYDGALVASPVVSSLKPHVEFTPVCPEVQIGLGVPRQPIRIVSADGRHRLIQPATGRDLTASMERFVVTFLAACGDIDGFVLKYRSPSCGIKGTKVFSDTVSKAPSGRTAGFFGGAVTARFPDLPVEDEGRLTNWLIREHFLTRVFTLAAFRDMAAARSMGALVEFQAANKLLLMAYSQKEMRVLGRIVANHAKLPVDEVLETYGVHLRRALAAAPRRGPCINVLMHALGYFSDLLSAGEKAFFLEALEAYRLEKYPLSVPVGIIGSYIARFDEPYLAGQRFLRPYPEDLVAVTDSGKGRDL